MRLATHLLVAALFVAWARAWITLVAPRLREATDIGLAYGAKLGCSIVFVANRSLASALDAESVFPPIKYISARGVPRRAAAGLPPRERGLWPRATYRLRRARRAAIGRARRHH